MDIFEHRLKELRKEKNLTQKELAIALSTTDDSIFSWEKGRSQPSIEMLRQLSTYFNVTSDYLIGLTDEFGTKTTTQINNLSHFHNSGTIKFQ